MSAPDPLETCIMLGALDGWDWHLGMVSLWHQPWNPSTGVMRVAAKCGDPNGDLTFRPREGKWELLGPDVIYPAMGGILFEILIEAVGGAMVDVSTWMDPDVRMFRVLIDNELAEHACTTLGQACALSIIDLHGTVH